MGLDAGVTEVLTTHTGEKYGEGYGKLLERLTEQTTETGKARNKLHQLAKKAEATGDIAKARRIRRHNLGTRNCVSAVPRARLRSRPSWRWRRVRRYKPRPR